MKRKFLLSAIALMLGGMLICFSACSCNSKSPLSFTSDWNNGENQIGYTEKAVYSVNYQADFKMDSLDYSVDQAIKDVVDFKFTDGTYTVTAKIEPKGNLPKKYVGNVLDSSVESVIHLTTDYSIKAHYKYGAKTDYDVYEDFIKTDAYFCLAGASYTPLYVVQENNYSLLSVGTDSANVISTHFKHEFIYSKETYVINKINPETDKVTKTDEYEYSYKTAIDNAELLFALRNLTIADVDGTSVLPTVSATYGAPKELLVKRHAGVSLNLPLSINGGAEQEESIPLRVYSFRLNDNLTSGKSQIVYIQSKKTDTLEYRSHVVRYVEPLTAYNSFNDMGVLVFTLNSVTYGKI